MKFTHTQQWLVSHLQRGAILVPEVDGETIKYSLVGNSVAPPPRMRSGIRSNDVVVPPAIVHSLQRAGILGDAQPMDSSVGFRDVISLTSAGRKIEIAGVIG